MNENVSLVSPAILATQNGEQVFSTTVASSTAVSIIEEHLGRKANNVNFRRAPSFPVPIVKRPEDDSSNSKASFRKILLSTTVSNY